MMAPTTKPVMIPTPSVRLVACRSSIESLTPATSSVSDFTPRAPEDEQGGEEHEQYYYTRNSDRVPDWSRVGLVAGFAHQQPQQNDDEDNKIQR